MEMVEYITYKDKKYPFRVGYYAIKKLKAEGKSLEDIEKSGDFEAYEDLLFYSLQQGHRVMDMEFEFKREDMEDVLDRCLTEFVPKIPDFFQGLEGMGEKMTDQLKEKQKKQNLQRKKE